MEQIIDRHKLCVKWVGKSGELFLIIATRGPIKVFESVCILLGFEIKFLAI